MNDTPTQLEVGEAIYNKFRDYFFSDTEPINDIGYGLKNTYELADLEQQHLIDKVFIDLCGYSLDTIIEEATAETKEKE